MPRALETVVQDVSYALRSFGRSPVFVLVSLLSLTLGIGATTAIFSVVHGVLIAPYPYARPGEIWALEVRAIDGRGGRMYVPDEFSRLAELPAFADAMATSIETVLLTGEFTPESFGGVLLTGNAFDFLGVPPVLGRTIQPSDIRPDGEVEPVVVLSHRLWLRLFDGSPSAIGRTLRLNGREHTIVGVMPPRFGWYGNEGFWLPLSPDRATVPWIAPIVRLAPGVTPAVAESQLDALNRRLAAEKPATFPRQGFTTFLRNYLDVTVASGEMRTSLRLLMGAVAFLLLIACANVANLQLARGTARAKEMAVRASIGAGRRRLLRQLLTESVLLSLAGGAFGVLMAFGAVQTIVALMPEFYVPNESRVTINVPVLLFSLGVSVLTGVVFGLVPALQTSNADAADVLRVGRSVGSGTYGSGTRNLLVVLEVALSVVLLVSAGLTVRTFVSLQHVDPGIAADRVLMMGVPLPPTRYSTLEARNLFFAELLDRVARLPGVVAASTDVPFGGAQSPFAIVGQPADDSRRMRINLVSADYLRTFGIPLRAGRMFDGPEVLRADRVAVISEAAARFWPAGESPLGSRVRLGVLEQVPPRTLADPGRPPEVMIVGIVGDTRNAGLRAAPAPALMMPYSILAPVQRALAIRTEGDPTLLLNPVRAQVRAMDPEQPLGRPLTVGDLLDQHLVQPRFTMALFSAFAALGLALAAAGIYSVLSFHVTRRTHELGIRMALGAPRSHVLGLMLRMGARLAAIGLAVGAAASVAATQLLRSQLFGVEPADPLAYTAVVVVLAVVTFAACYLPARRAATTDPLVALREQ